MRKNLTIFISVILLLAMALALTGCGATEKEKLVGTWEGVLDLTDIFNEAVAPNLNEDLSEFLEFHDVKLTLILTFHEDDTFSMQLDEDALNIAVAGMREDFAASMESYLEQLFAGMGEQMTIDEIMETMGTTMEDLVEENISDTLIENLANGFAREGMFKAEDGKLYLSSGLNDEVDSGNYDTYTLKGDTLTFMELISTQEVDAFAASLYPMVFQKVS